MKKDKKEDPTFWLTNISNRNVSLTDLNLTVKAFSSVNLLDNKHYQYTIDQLNNSVSSGSIFKKRDKLFVRKVAPNVIKSNISINKEAIIPTRGKSVFNITEETYEELNVSDEIFAEENAETAELDQKPLIIKGNT